MLLFLVSIASSASASSSPSSIMGNERCPCLHREEFLYQTQRHQVAEPHNIFQVSQQQQQQQQPQVSNSYGIGCFAHDVNTTACRQTGANASFCEDSEQDDCRNKQEDDDNKSWCKRSWCYVDPTRCDLLHRQDGFIHYYSYATCNEMDAFTKDQRLKALKGRTLQVGLTSNSGGWLGAYQQDGIHFAPSKNLNQRTSLIQKHINLCPLSKTSGFSAPF